METREPRTVSAPTISSYATCEAFLGGGGPESLAARVPTAIQAIGPGVNSAQVRELAEISDELEGVAATAPPGMAASLRSVQVPFRQAEDALAGGGGSLTLDTGSPRDGALAMISACDAAGYIAPPVPTSAPESVGITEGMYLVGTDIEPGTYRSAGPTSAGTCFYFLTGEAGAAIDSGATSGPSVVTIPAEAHLFETSYCQPWTPVE